MISASGMVLALKLRGLFPYIHTWGVCAHIPPTQLPHCPVSVTSPREDQ